jgi:phage terminase large subunit
MTLASVELPPKLVDLFEQPRGALLYRAAHGGRGSGKSFGFAKLAAIWGYAEPMRVLCTREFQASIKESFHAELKAAIASEPWLAAHYDVGIDYLRGANGTEFIFRGLRHNTGSVKSIAKIDLTIVEEAEDVPEASWLALEPTVFRQPRAELWAIWNPRQEGSPVDLRFRAKPPASSAVVEMNWQDNPFFPPELEALRRREQERLDPATYAHVWEGAYLTNSDAQVLSGKVRVAEFTAGDGWDGPYHGLDYGFAQDPSAAVRCWVHDDRLWVDYEAGKVGLEIDQTPGFLMQRIPAIASHALRADSARPESTSYLRRHGLPHTVSVAKWPGSVEDGIAHLRGYAEIVVHPRCKETLRETRLWSYKRDRLSGDVLPVLVDANNHYMDALRYALAPLIRRASIPVPMKMNFTTPTAA